MCCHRDIHAINFSPEGCVVDAEGHDEGGSEKERVVLSERDNETSLCFVAEERVGVGQGVRIFQRMGQHPPQNQALCAILVGVYQ